MRKTICTLILAVAALAAMAQSARVAGLAANQRLVGYTVTDDIDIHDAAFGTAGTYTIGAVMQPSMVASYEGCRIVGIRFALGQSVGRTRAFVYQVNDGSLQELMAQKQRTYEGWNTLLFNGNGYEIQGDETLFFGFDYVESDEMVAADEGAICGVGNDTEGAFYGYGNFGQGEGLYSLSGIGRLCVQLIVDVSNLPSKDIDMTYLDAGFRYKQPGESFDMLYSYQNAGRDSVFQYEMGIQLDDRTPMLYQFADTLAYGASESQQVDVTIPADAAVGPHTLRVFVSCIEGQPLERILNDTLSFSFFVYDQTMERNQVYAEVYNHQGSPYVPYLDKVMAELLQQSDHIALVNTFSPDSPLSNPDTDYLFDLYAYTYPTFTSNRAYFPGEAYIAYDMNDYLAQLPTSFMTGIVGPLFEQDYESAAFASINLAPQYDRSTRQLTVRATGEVLPVGTAIYGQMALTLLLTEDEVVGQQAVYNEVRQRTEWDYNYKHQRVLRAFMTSPLGDALTLTDNHYQYDCTLRLSDEWDPAKLHLVGFLTRAADAVTDANVLEMDITNCTSMPLAPITTPTAIHRPATADDAPTRFYSIDGTAIAEPSAHRGITIVRMPDGTTRKTIRR